MSNGNETAKGMGRRRGPMGGRGMTPGEKPKDLKGAIGKLASYIRHFKFAIVIVAVFAACSTVFSVIGPKILGKATTALSEGLMAKIRGTGGIDFTYIGKILLFVLGLYLLSALFSFVQGWIMTGVTQKICYQLRKEISEKINRMPMKYFESRTYGEVLSRITNDVDTLGQGLNQSITTIITSVATLIGVFIMMLSISPLMTLIALVILPVSAGLISFVVKKSQKYFKNQQEYLGHINGQVEEIYGGHLVIKAFNREQDTIKEFDATNQQLYESAWKSQFLSGMMQPIMMFVGNLGYAAVALSGGLLAIRGTITIGDIQAFIQYVKSFTQPIQQIAQVINQVQSMAAASERVFEFLNEEEEDQSVENPCDISKVTGEVSFEHVHFGYQPDQTIIHDFSVNVAPGQKIAIVGPTGAGKTTMVKLLTQLALDYARVERCAPGEAAPAVRALIQKLRDSLEEMSTLMRQIDQSHIRYRKRAVQRAQFLLLSDRSSQGSVTALLRRYAEEIKTPDQLFAPDDGPVAKRLHLYPAAVFGAKPLYPPAAPRSETPLAPVRQAGLDAEQLRKEQQLLLDYARMAVTEENVGLLAKQALAARSAVAASTLSSCNWVKLIH